MNGRTFVLAEELPTLFAGMAFRLSTMRVVLPDGRELKRSQFKVLFGGLTFALDRENVRTTRDAWRAFTDNQAFRPPII